MPGDYKKVTINIDRDILEKIDSIAKEKRMSRTSMIQMAVLEYIQAKEAFDAIGGIDTLAKYMKKIANKEA